MRVVIADDSALLRQGIARLLQGAGFEVVAEVGSADDLLRAVEETRPDAAIVDIRMPPTHTDEGIVVAERLGREFPEVGVLVLSQYLEAAYALRLLDEMPERVGYLLKERVSDIAVIADALHRIMDGECVLDPTIVTRLLRGRRRREPLDQLTSRELAVLAAIAEGRSNVAIGRLLHMSEKTVEAHTGQIFVKLGLERSGDDHRRVLAVVSYLKRQQADRMP